MHYLCTVKKLMTLHPFINQSIDLAINNIEAKLLTAIAPNDSTV